jgi:hypothetical protein
MKHARECWNFQIDHSHIPTVIHVLVMIEVIATYVVQSWNHPSSSGICQLWTGVMANDCLFQARLGQQPSRNTLPRWLSIQKCVSSGLVYSIWPQDAAVGVYFAVTTITLLNVSSFNILSVQMLRVMHCQTLDMSWNTLSPRAPARNSTSRGIPLRPWGHTCNDINAIIWNQAALSQTGIDVQHNMETGLFAFLATRI